MMETFSDISHGFYINLSHRTDRREHVEHELHKVGLSPVIMRFNAISNRNGAVGCSMSHLACLKYAMEQKWPHVLIVEDDVTFLHPEQLMHQFATFMQRRKQSWDVLLLAGNNIPPHVDVDDVCIQVKRCQTTTAYLVNGTYLPTLISNVHDGLTRLIRQPQLHAQFAIDVWWKSLQCAHRWFLLSPPTVIQMAGYSDIEQRNVNYERAMTDIHKVNWQRRPPPICPLL